MGIKKKIKHAIGKKKEKEIAFEVDNHKVIKTEDYICNSNEEGYGEGYVPVKYLHCSKESRIKTTVYVTNASVRYEGTTIRYTVYVFPVISDKKKKWTLYLHNKDGYKEDDYSGSENNEYYDTPREAIEAALDMIAAIPYT